VLDALLLVSTVAFIATGGVVGVRLLRLALRTRELSDFLVGFSLFDLSAVAYPLILLGSLGDLSLSAAKQALVASSLTMVLGWMGVFAFTQRVFRPGNVAARALAAVGCAMLLYGLVAGIAYIQRAETRAALESSASPLLWIQFAAVAAYAWTAYEGLRCWLQARKRMKLGLAEPLVANRFLLWGCVGLASLLSVAPSLMITLGGGDGTRHAAARLSTAIGGLLASLALQLAFLPTERYRRWVEARSAA
jgi:hypothetical protein